MATYISTDANGKLKVQVEPNDAETYLPNDTPPDPAEIATIKSQIAGIISDISALQGDMDNLPIIKTGSSTELVTIPANGYIDQTYNFGYTFTAVPRVYLTITGTGDSGLRGSVSAMLSATTTTSTTVRFYNNTNAALGVHLNWLAIVVKG